MMVCRGWDVKPQPTAGWGSFGEVIGQMFSIKVLSDQYMHRLFFPTDGPVTIIQSTNHDLERQQVFVQTLEPAL